MYACGCLFPGFSGVVSEVRINPILSNDDHNHTRYTTPSIPKEPHFASDSPEEVMAAMGTPAHIPCKARSLGAKSVSKCLYHYCSYSAETLTHYFKLLLIIFYSRINYTWVAVAL